MWCARPGGPVARLLVHPLDDRRIEGREPIGVHVGAEQSCIDVVADAGDDRPSTGATPKARNPLDIDELTERLVAAAGAEGLDTFAVSGYSLGCPVAISSLVLSASFTYAETRTDLAASVWHQLFASGQQTLLAEYLNLMGLGEAALNALTPDQAHVIAEQLAPDRTPAVRRTPSGVAGS
ncbi:hypothetical protein SVIOM74S_03720 [Streptomyces violarus]